MFLLQENRVRVNCKNRDGGRTGECFFCGSDRLSAAKTGPTQTAAKEHAEKRAAGLPGAIQLNISNLTGRVV